MAASRARQGGQALAIEEQDMSITWVFGGSLFLMLPIGALLWFELSGGPLAGASGSSSERASTLRLAQSARASRSGSTSVETLRCRKASTTSPGPRLFIEIGRAHV